MLEPTPRVFRLDRAIDHTGASGVGTVADGVVWPDGTVTLRSRGAYASTVIWDSLDAAVAVHGHGGDTSVVWADGTEVMPPVDPVALRIVTEEGWAVGGLVQVMSPFNEDTFSPEGARAFGRQYLAAAELAERQIAERREQAPGGAS